MSRIIDWIKLKSNDKFQFMSLIGGAFVFVFLSICIIQIFETNWLFATGKITIEVYERLVLVYYSRIFEIVSMIFFYFFRNPSDKGKEEIKIEETTAAPTEN